MDYDAYTVRAATYDDEHDFVHAIDDYNRAFAIAPPNKAASTATSLGHVYTEKRDYRAAMYWFRIAADRGDTNAMYMIGVFYASRVLPDCESARNWFKKAATGGNELAAENFNRDLMADVIGRNDERVSSICTACRILLGLPRRFLLSAPVNGSRSMKPLACLGSRSRCCPVTRTPSSRQISRSKTTLLPLDRTAH